LSGGRAGRVFLFGDGAREIVYSVTMAADHSGRRPYETQVDGSRRDRREILHAGEVRIIMFVGPANGRPIVFIPAQGMTWENTFFFLPDCWPPTFRSSRYHCQVMEVVVDAREIHFRSARVAVSEFLREVVGRPAIVGGNSSAEFLAMWLAANVLSW